MDLANTSLSQSQPHLDRDKANLPLFSRPLDLIRRNK